MKTIITALVLMLLVACNSNDSDIKYSYSVNNNGTVKREMIIKNANTDVEIKMEGNATFNDESTQITAITSGGYINYRNNDIELNATPEKNNVAINIEKAGVKISNTSDTGKEIIADAIRNIKKLQQKHK